MVTTKSKWEGIPNTACFIFPEASGHINASLALSARLAKKKHWKVHYLSALVMKPCIENSGATFDDERDAAPELCEDRNDGNGRPGYFVAYERLKSDMMPDSKAWEGRAHLENKFLLMKLPGTIEWLRRKRPSVVVYCPIWNRVAQIASLVVGIPHVPIVTIAGFGGFHKILGGFIEPEGVTLDDFRSLYEKSETNQEAINELCSQPFNLDKNLFEDGAPVYYFGREPDSAPYVRTLGKHTLVTTIEQLRDPIYESMEDEDKLYMDHGVKMHYVGPMLGEPGQIRASTFKAVWTIEEQQLLIQQTEQTHRRRSRLRGPDNEVLIDIVKQAKARNRRVVLVSLGTVVTSDRAAFGWQGHGLYESITGKELVQSVIGGVIDALGLFSNAILDSVKADESSSPLLVCAVGQQPDATDDLILPPNAICRASVPQVDILRHMDSHDLFVHHGGQNSCMEGAFAGIPVVVCPTFSDQPVNAKKLVKCKVGLKVDRPTSSGERAVKSYRKEVADAVLAIYEEEETFSTASALLREKVQSSGGEEAAEVVLLQAIDEGIDL